MQRSHNASNAANNSVAASKANNAAAANKRVQGYRLSPAEEEIIKVSFESFSEEVVINQKTGEKGMCITTLQLKEAFHTISAESDIHDIQLLIDDIDMNGDGIVDENEWRNIMMRKFLGEDDESSVMHIFSMLDDNKDGFIPLVELRSILMREGLAPLSEQEVDELLMFADVESDGLINYKAFLSWLACPQVPKKSAAEEEAERIKEAEEEEARLAAEAEAKKKASPRGEPTDPAAKAAAKAAPGGPSASPTGESQSGEKKPAARRGRRANAASGSGTT